MQIQLFRDQFVFSYFFHFWLILEKRNSFSLWVSSNRAVRKHKTHTHTPTYNSGQSICNIKFFFFQPLFFFKNETTNKVSTQPDQILIFFLISFDSIDLFFFVYESSIFCRFFFVYGMLNSNNRTYIENLGNSKFDRNWEWV